MNAKVPVVVAAVALPALSTLWIFYEMGRCRCAVRKRFPVADIVAVQMDVGREYVLTTAPFAGSETIGSVYVRQPNRPQWTGAHLSVMLDGRTLSDEDEPAVWVDRLRDHAAALRT